MNPPSTLLPVIVIVGSTSVGKTKLSLDIAKAFGGEVVCADSIQVYEDLDIASAKPTPTETSSIPHHLVSCYPPETSIDVKTFVKAASDAIDSIHKRGKIPIICGGTFHWVEALLFRTLVTEQDNLIEEYDSSDIGDYAEGYAEEYTLQNVQNGSEITPLSIVQNKKTISVERDGDLTPKEYQKALLLRGQTELYAELQRLDPSTAKLFPSTDNRKTRRCLEFIHQTGTCRSDAVEKTGGIYGSGMRYLPCFLWVTARKRVIYRRLSDRIAMMNQMNVADEVRALFLRLMKSAFFCPSQQFLQNPRHLPRPLGDETPSNLDGNSEKSEKNLIVSDFLLTTVQNDTENADKIDPLPTVSINPPCSIDKVKASQPQTSNFENPMESKPTHSIWTDSHLQRLIQDVQCRITNPESFVSENILPWTHWLTLQRGITQAIGFKEFLPWAQYTFSTCLRMVTSMSGLSNVSTMSSATFSAALDVFQNLITPSQPSLKDYIPTSQLIQGMGYSFHDQNKKEIMKNVKNVKNEEKTLPTKLKTSALNISTLRLPAFDEKQSSDHTVKTKILSRLMMMMMEQHSTSCPPSTIDHLTMDHFQLRQDVDQSKKSLEILWGCFAVLLINTRKYADRQIKWIRNRLVRIYAKYTQDSQSLFESLSGSEYDKDDNSENGTENRNRIAFYRFDSTYIRTTSTDLESGLVPDINDAEYYGEKDEHDPFTERSDLVSPRGHWSEDVAGPAIACVERFLSTVPPTNAWSWKSPPSHSHSLYNPLDYILKLKNADTATSHLKTEPTELLAASNRGSQHICDLCSKSVSGLDNWKSHLGSKGHKAMVKRKNGDFPSWKKQKQENSTSE